MKIPDKGLEENALFQRLESFHEKDLEMRDGKMFGHAFLVNDSVRKVVEKAYTMYLWKNALDPTLFPSLLQLENEVVAMSRAHLRGDDDVVGNFTSGGTESILLAVKAMRDKARSERPEITEPEMILPVTAHAAFHKAAHYFCIKTVLTPVDPETFKADVSAIKKAISSNTVLIVASAPSYAHGVIDPIGEIGELALEDDIPLHIDGCIGAFLLPYYRQLGVDVPDFDFTVPGVTSISMDFHKYSFAAKGASVILYRNKKLRRYQIFSCSDWTGYTVLNPTVQSSRSGGPLAGTWAVLKFLGNDGYLEVVRKLKGATDKVIEGINEMDDLYVLGKPEMCLLGIGSETVNVFHIVDEMKERGWHIQAQLGLANTIHRENFHLTILPSNIDRIDEWLGDLRECVEIAKTREPGKLAEQISALLPQTDTVEIDDDDIWNLFKLVGIEGDALPGRMAEINEILNALPPKLADTLLVAYLNEVS